MTTLRQAAQQALEALEAADVDPHSSDAVYKAITALKAALAEPVQEPVAWRWGYRSVTTGEMDWRGYVEIAADPNLRSPAIIMEPLYTAPPQRKPLTEEEIGKVAAPYYGTMGFRVEAFARAIERAHGIGEKE